MNGWLICLGIVDIIVGLANGFFHKDNRRLKAKIITLIFDLLIGSILIYLGVK